jgi:hypothetical protein
MQQVRSAQLQRKCRELQNTGTCTVYSRLQLAPLLFTDTFMHTTDMTQCKT